MVSSRVRTWPDLLAVALCLLVAKPLWAVTGSRPENFVQVPGSKLYFEECGTGAEAVVLIHDGVVDSAVWDDVWPEFCRTFHTIRYDRRGYGRTPESASSYSEVDDLVELLRH